MPMPDDHLPQRSWAKKFADAFRGLKQGVRGQSSFFVHFFLAAVVLVAAAVLRVERVEWCLLVLCIAGVLAAEMFRLRAGVAGPGGHRPAAPGRPRRPGHRHRRGAGLCPRRRRGRAADLLRPPRRGAGLVELRDITPLSLRERPLTWCPG